MKSKLVLHLFIHSPDMDEPSLCVGKRVLVVSDRLAQN